MRRAVFVVLIIALVALPAMMGGCASKPPTSKELLSKSTAITQMSFDAKLQGPTLTIEQKVWVLGNKMRADVSGDGLVVSTLCDWDAGTQCFWDSTSDTGSVVKLTGFLPYSPHLWVKEFAQVEGTVGERADRGGTKCRVITYAPVSSLNLGTTRMWVTEATGLPIYIESVINGAEASIEYTNIKTSGISPDQLKVPANIKLVDETNSPAESQSGEIETLLAKGLAWNELSFDLKITAPEVSILQKNWVLDNKLRIDIKVSDSMTSCTICDFDAKTQTCWDTQTKTGAIIKMGGFVPYSPAAWANAFTGVAGTLGEVADRGGVRCRAITFSAAKDGTLAGATTMWISEGSGLPMYVESEFGGVKTTFEFLNIQVGGVSPDVFKVPSDVKIVDQSK